MKFRDAIEEVRSRADIIEIVGSNVALKRAGRNYKGLCPFHAEKTASFTVSPDKQLFHCFGCQAGGSVFDFIMRIRNFSFVEATEYLAERHGVIIEMDSRRGDGDHQREEKRALYEINRLAADFFHENLMHSQTGAEARAYLAKRGIDDECIKKFELGLALESWDQLSKHFVRQGIVMKRAEHLGLISSKDKNPDQPLGFYDRFRGRIIFPILSLKEQVVGFGGRLLQGEGPKYLNSPQSLIFDKSRTLYLANLAQEGLRKSRRAIVVEGYTDAIALHRHGFVEAVATLGTSLTNMHGKLLARLVDEVTTLYDGDEAGFRAALRTLEPMIQNGLDSQVVLLPAGEDPDSMLSHKGKQGMADQLEQAREIISLCVGKALEESSTKARASSLEQIAKTIQQTPNRFQRELFLKRFQEVSGIAVEAVVAIQTSRPPATEKAAATSEMVENSPPSGPELMLVALAFENENVYELLRTYEGPPLMASPLVRDIMEEQFVAGKPSAGDLGHIMDTLEQLTFKQQLQKIIFDVGEIPANQHMRAARDCMQKILGKRFKSRMLEFSQQISIAEQQGDLQRVHDLLEEKKNLLKTLQGN